MAVPVAAVVLLMGDFVLAGQAIRHQQVQVREITVAQVTTEAAGKMLRVVAVALVQWVLHQHQQLEWAAQAVLAQPQA